MKPPKRKVRAFYRFSSKRRRRAGADHFAGLCADAAETVWPAAFEIIGIAGMEDMALVVDRHLQPAGDHDAAFLAFVNQRHPAGVAAGLVALLQDLQGATEQIVPDLAIRNRLLADLGQFVGAVERFLLPLRLKGEEFGQSHWNTVEDALERADGGIHLVGFDQRDRRIGHAGALCEFALRDLVTRPNESQPSTNIDAHREIPVAGVADRANMYLTPQQDQWVAAAQKRACCGPISVVRLLQSAMELRRDPSSDSEHPANRFVLDAVHGQPSVQKSAASARLARVHALHAG